MARTIILFLVSLTLFCCDGTMRYAYTPSCIRVDSDFELDPALLEKDVGLAAQILEDRLLTAKGTSFCGAFSDQYVEVLETRSFPCSVDQCDGQTNEITGTITTGNRFDALVHELLHIWDRQHLVDSHNHTDWDTNGYYAMDTAFTLKMTPPWRY